MPEPAGNLCIVLHGHLPYVLHHGDYPHGEAWLFEAAAETYLPLLDMIGEVALMQKRPGLTIGLTPVLLEQLAHPRFKERFVAYLDERIERAQRDRADFEKKGEKHFAYLAAEWTRWHERRREHFERIGRDIPGEFARRFAEGHIQILTSNATHCYMPLVLNDEMLAAQMACGTATSERHLGVRPEGMWLPECAYRPHWPHWMPSVLYDNPRDRPGLERFMQAAGVTHFFVESHLIQNASPMGYREGGRFHSGGGYRPGSNRPRGQRAGRAARLCLRPPSARQRAGLEREHRLPGGRRLPGVPPQARRARPPIPQDHQYEDGALGERPVLPGRHQRQALRARRALLRCRAADPLAISQRDGTAGDGGGELRCRIVRALVVRGGALSPRRHPDAGEHGRRQAGDGAGGAGQRSAG
jgi:hypothetical protein